jgi:hypothetical protein
MQTVQYNDFDRIKPITYEIVSTAQTNGKTNVHIRYIGKCQTVRQMFILCDGLTMVGQLTPAQREHIEGTVYEARYFGL